MAVDPITFGAASKWVYGAYSLLTGGNRLSAADRAAIDAAGVRPFRGVFRGAGGLVLSQSQAINRGRAILAAQAPVAAPLPAPPPYATPGDILREVFERNPTYRPGTSVPVPGNPDFEDLLRRPSPDIGTRTPTTWNPNAPPRTVPRVTAGSAVGVLARAAGLLGGLLYPTPTADSDLGYETKSAPAGEPPDPRRGPASRFRRRDRPDPRRPPLGQTIPDRMPPRDPRPTTIGEPLRAPLPVPIGAPLPAPRPRPQPRPTTTAGPRTSFDPLPLLLLRSIPRPGRTPDTLSPVLPGRPTGGTNRSPLSDRQPLTAPLPRPLPYAPPIGEPPCSCSSTRTKPKRKRKPREVCYRGTFTETRSSTLKVRKETIPCQ